MPGEEIFFLSISELSKRIESKKLSPVELTELYLDRSQKFGPRFNAYATLPPVRELLLPRASPVLPSARKPGARSFALRRFAVSADCGQPTAASAAMARWPSLRRWTRSGPWLAAPKIAREFLPPLPGTIQKTAVRLPSTRPLSRTRLRLKCASSASAGFTMPGTLSMAEAQGPLRQQDQS